MDSFINYGKQDITEDDVNAVIAALKSEHLTQGPVVPMFEQLLAEYCDVQFATATNSATSALHISCLALDLQAGDWLWTTAISFVASSNCALYCGAKVDFVDINPTTNNICALKLKEKLELAEKENLLPKIIVAVHLCGLPAEMKDIKELSDKYGFSIIEDASHAIGAEYLSDKVGNCKFSDITVFSFHPVKIITTGEGGAALTKNSKLHNRLQLLRSHGITRDHLEMVNPVNQSWYYEQIELGFNYRMTDIQAALGISQLGRIDSYIEKRHQIAKMYKEQLNDLPIEFPTTESIRQYSSLHLYVIKVNIEYRDFIFESLKNDNIGANLHYIPIYQHPYYRNLDTLYKPLENAEKYYKSAITIPLHPKIKDDEILRITSSIRAAMK